MMIEMLARTVGLPRHTVIEALRENAIWIEVTGLAIDDFVVPSDIASKDYAKEEDRGSAVYFVLSQEPNELNLKNICEGLGLDYRRVRTILFAMSVESSFDPPWADRRDKRLAEFLERVYGDWKDGSRTPAD